jgi:putative membrane protein
MLVLLSFAVLVLGGTVNGLAAAQPALNEQDRTFLIQAHRANLTEIEAGKTAQNKASDQTVRDLGERLIADHTKLDADVRKVAETAGVQLPSRPSPKQRAVLERVSGLSGAAFDREWVASQIAGHRQTLANGAKELRDGSSAEVKQLATDAKPIVQEHLDMLENARSAGTTPESTPSAS